MLEPSTPPVIFSDLSNDPHELVMTAPSWVEVRSGMTRLYVVCRNGRTYWERWLGDCAVALGHSPEC